MRVVWLCRSDSLECVLPACIRAVTCARMCGRVSRTRDARASRPEAFASNSLRRKESMTLTRAWKVRTREHDRWFRV